MTVSSYEQPIDTIAAVAAAQRPLDAVAVVAAGEVARRSEPVDVERRITHALGCASVYELLQRSARVSAATAGRWQRVATAVHEKLDLRGEPVAAPLPALREVHHVTEHVRGGPAHTDNGPRRRAERASPRRC